MTSKEKKATKSCLSILRKKLNKIGPSYFSCDYGITVMLTVEEVFLGANIGGDSANFDP
jgi:hypothetical protein